MTRALSARWRCEQRDQDPTESAHTTGKGTDSPLGSPEAHPHPERSTATLLPGATTQNLQLFASLQQRARRAAGERTDLLNVPPRPSICGAAPPQKPPRKPKTRHGTTSRLPETNVRLGSDERSGFAREATASPRKLMFPEAAISRCMASTVSQWRAARSTQRASTRHSCETDGLAPAPDRPRYPR